MYLNKIQIIGNLTRDPELKALPNGQNVCSFSVATNRTWKDAEGSKKEEVEFHNCVSFGKQAETLAMYMKKGSQIYVEGRNRTRNWDGTDGKKIYRTEIMVENFQFGAKAGGATASKDSAEPQDEEINPEDIPF